MSKTAKRAFLLILVLSAGLRLYLSLFVKTAAVYNDELFYLEMAQNFWRKGALTVYTVPIHFSKLLYSLLLAPFFAVKDGLLRTQLISGFNALLVSSSLIPGYLLAKRTLKKTGHLVAVLLLLALSPNLLFPLTFMAENLYLSLLLWGFYAAYRYFSSENKKPVHAFLLGLMAFALYFAKEVGAAFAAGLAVALLAGRMGNKKGRKEVYLPLGLYLLGIAVPYVLLRLTLLSSMSYSYGAQVSLSNLSGSSQLLYFLYAFLVMLLHFGLTVLFLPVALPLLNRDKLSPARQRLLVLSVSYIIAVAAGIAFGVSLYGDYPAYDIAGRVRYFIGAAFPFLLLALPLWEEAGPLTRKSPLLRHAAVFAGLCAVFLLIPKINMFVDTPAFLFTTLLNRASVKWLWVWKLAPAALLGAALLFWNKKRKQALACFLAVLSVFALVSDVVFVRTARQMEAVNDPELIEEVQKVDAFLDEDETRATLVLANSPFTRQLRLLNTFSDNDYAFATYRSVRDTALREDIPDPQRLSYTGQPLPNPIAEFSARDTYDLQKVDQVVCIEETDLPDLSQYENVTPEGVTTYTILRAKDPSVLALRDLKAYTPGDEITFGGDDASFFCLSPSGFAHNEAEWCWTLGKEASLTIHPQMAEPKDLKACWSWRWTIGDQPCQVLANDTPVWDGILTTDDAYCFFTVPKETWADTGVLTLRFLLPEACPPGNGDPQELAVAFESLILTEDE